MASADILRAARARIEDPKNWTKHFLAVDAKGELVACEDSKAICWCAYGALQAEGSDWLLSEPSHFLRRGAETISGRRNPATVNDELGHAAVLRMYDAAIAAAEREAGQ